jgi:tetratricopeptide (TPR) repeat protein
MGDNGVAQEESCRVSVMRISKFRALAPRCISSVLAGALALGGGATVAQQSCMGGMAMGGAKDGMRTVPPPEQLPVPIRMTGIGNSHITIKANAEAQAWFDQGLSLMHDFWDYESAKAFEQAARVDPQCAMCYWGLAEVEGFRGGPEKIYGTKALAKAGELKKHASGSDKLYIEAAQAGADAKNGDNAPAILILRKLVKKHPQDIEARIFLANALGDGYDDKGEPQAGTKEKIAILEGAMKDAPNDSAANHYWIHAMEPSNHPERAIPSAALLASLAPTSGHMVHMPGHIYYRVGDYADADKWFSASTAADEKYMHEQHVGPDDDWNYVHNMMYRIANLMEQGRLAEANALSDRLAGARGQLSATLYNWSARDQMARVSRRLPVALRLGDWDGVLTLLDNAPIAENDKTANLLFLKSELREFAVGMRALDRNDAVAAKAASERFDAGLWRVQQDQADAEQPTKLDAAKKDAPPMIPVNPDAESGPLVCALSVASLELRAGVLVAQGKLEPAKKLYAQAATEEKKLGYHEPPFYIRPVAETEAGALLKAKDYAGAKTAYEAALVERPASGFELYGIARTKELSGDAAGARVGYQAFLKAWPTADAGLPEVAHAREALNSPTRQSGN